MEVGGFVADPVYLSTFTQWQRPSWRFLRRGPDGHDYLHRGSHSFSVSPPQSVIFIRDRNTLGQEVSGYIDYAHRLKNHDFEPYFNGKKRLLPGRSDLWWVSFHSDMSAFFKVLDLSGIWQDLSGKEILLSGIKDSVWTRGTNISLEAAEQSGRTGACCSSRTSDKLKA